MAEMTVPQVLRRAEQIIGQRGWCQDEFEETDGRVCAAGAIRLAAGGTTYAEQLTDEQYALAADAEDILSEQVGGGGVTHWNDELDRMAIEVRYALLAAARRAEAKAGT